jgi:hypothetical protein
MPTTGIMPTISKSQQQVSYPTISKTNNIYHAHHFKMPSTVIIFTLSKEQLMHHVDLILLSTRGIMPALSKLKKGKILGLEKDRDNPLFYCSYRSTFKLSSNPHCEKE